MPTQIQVADIANLQNSLIHWLVLEAISDYANRHDVDMLDVFHIEPLRRDGTPPPPVEVKLIVNGVEVDALEILNRISSQIHDLTRQQAERLLAEKFGNVLQNVQTLEQLAQNALDGFLATPR